MSSAPSEVTRLLQRWTAGDVQARDQLIPLVYDRLRQLAHWRLRRAPGEAPANQIGRAQPLIPAPPKHRMPPSACKKKAPQVAAASRPVGATLIAQWTACPVRSRT